MRLKIVRLCTVCKSADRNHCFFISKLIFLSCQCLLSNKTFWNKNFINNEAVLGWPLVFNLFLYPFRRGVVEAWNAVLKRVAFCWTSFSPPPPHLTFCPVVGRSIKGKTFTTFEVDPWWTKDVTWCRWTQMMTRQIEIPKNVERGEEVWSLFVFFNSVPRRFDKDCGRLNPLHHKISVHVFHTLATRFLWYWQRIRVITKASKVGNHFLYSYDVKKLFSSIIVRRNWTLVTLRV